MAPDELIKKYKRLTDTGAAQSDIMDVLVQLDAVGVDILELVRSYEGAYPYKLMFPSHED